MDKGKSPASPPGAQDSPVHERKPAFLSGTTGTAETLPPYASEDPLAAEPDDPLPAGPSNSFRVQYPRLPLESAAPTETAEPPTYEYPRLPEEWLPEEFSRMYELDRPSQAALDVAELRTELSDEIQARHLIGDENIGFSPKMNRYLESQESAASLRTARPQIAGRNLQGPSAKTMSDGGPNRGGGGPATPTPRGSLAPLSPRKFQEDKDLVRSPVSNANNPPQTIREMKRKTSDPVLEVERSAAVVKVADDQVTAKENHRRLLEWVEKQSARVKDWRGLYTQEARPDRHMPRKKKQTPLAKAMNKLFLGKSRSREVGEAQQRDEEYPQGLRQDDDTEEHLEPEQGYNREGQEQVQSDLGHAKAQRDREQSPMEQGQEQSSAQQDREEPEATGEDSSSNNDSKDSEGHPNLKAYLEEEEKLMLLKPHEVHYSANVIARLFVDLAIIREPWKMVIGYDDESLEEAIEQPLIYWYNIETKEIDLDGKKIAYIRGPGDNRKAVIWERRAGEKLGYGYFLPAGMPKTAL